jgi:hypothetical protein
VSAIETGLFFLLREEHAEVCPYPGEGETAGPPPWEYWFRTSNLIHAHRPAQGDERLEILEAYRLTPQTKNEVCIFELRGQYMKMLDLPNETPQISDQPIRRRMSSVYVAAESLNAAFLYLEKHRPHFRARQASWNGTLKIEERHRKKTAKRLAKRLRRAERRAAKAEDEAGREKGHEIVPQSADEA